MNRKIDNIDFSLVQKLASAFFCIKNNLQKAVFLIIIQIWKLWI